jgi:hypothetical protein
LRCAGFIPGSTSDGCVCAGEAFRVLCSFFSWPAQ